MKYTVISYYIPLSLPFLFVIAAVNNFSCELIIILCVTMPYLFFLPACSSDRLYTMKLADQ